MPCELGGKQKGRKEGRKSRAHQLSFLSSLLLQPTCPSPPSSQPSGSLPALSLRYHAPSPPLSLLEPSKPPSTSVRSSSSSFPFPLRAHASFPPRFLLYQVSQLTKSETADELRSRIESAGLEVVGSRILASKASKAGAGLVKVMAQDEVLLSDVLEAVRSLNIKSKGEQVSLLPSCFVASHLRALGRGGEGRDPGAQHDLSSPRLVSFPRWDESSSHIGRV